MFQGSAAVPEAIVCHTILLQLVGKRLTRILQEFFPHKVNLLYEANVFQQHKRWIVVAAVFLSRLFLENQEHQPLPSESNPRTSYWRKKTNSPDYTSTMEETYIPWPINVGDTKPSPLASVRDISKGSTQLQSSLWNCLRHLGHLYCLSSLPVVLSCFFHSLGVGVLWSTSK